MLTWSKIIQRFSENSQNNFLDPKSSLTRPLILVYPILVSCLSFSSNCQTPFSHEALTSLRLLLKFFTGWELLLQTSLSFFAPRPFQTSRITLGSTFHFCRVRASLTFVIITCLRILSYFSAHPQKPPSRAPSSPVSVRLLTILQLRRAAPCSALSQDQTDTHY